ncbi:MAG: hypothetical protein HDT25_02505 [Ruminococcus sp.]|nr:hypothetical protein [Ruminococcus sp.]
MVHYFTSRYDSTQRKIVMFLGVVFLVLGVILLLVSLWNIVRMENSRRVIAMVVDVIETRSNYREEESTGVLYTPVYEYYDNGEVRTYKSLVSTSMLVEVGDKATLYISDNGIIYEKTSTLITLFMGILFAVTGGMFTFVTVVIMRKKLPKRRNKAS